MLEDCERFLARMEQLATRQEEATSSFQRLPGAIRDAGGEAAALVAQDARRALLDATRSLAAACSDLRIASHAAAAAFPKAAWRTSLICAVCAAAGGILSGAAVALMLRL